MRVTGPGAIVGLLLLAPSATPAHPVSDAEALALELCGELLAPPALVATVDTHLQAIRSVEPTLGAVRPYPPWEPGVLLVMLYAPAFDEYLAGTYTGLDSLNAVYGPVTVTAVYEFIRMIVLEFGAHYNGALLAAIYGTAPGVANAGANTYGFTDTDITAAELGDYTFRYGWLSCPLGCVYNHYWRYWIDGAGAPVLLDEWGDNLVGVSVPETNPPPGLRLEGASPNPFAKTTRITASVPAGAVARLDIVDAAGRRVRALPGLRPSDGVQSMEWDGRDGSGRPVASGVYFVVLQSNDGARDTRRVVHLR